MLAIMVIFVINFLLTCEYLISSDVRRFLTRERRSHYDGTGIRRVYKRGNDALPTVQHHLDAQRVSLRLSPSLYRV